MKKTKIEKLNELSNYLNVDRNKLFTDLYTIDEFIVYYYTATKIELRNRLKTLNKKVKTRGIKNEIDAINTLLYENKK